jgi:hypothetical protein
MQFAPGMSTTFANDALRVSARGDLSRLVFLLLLVGAGCSRPVSTNREAVRMAYQPIVFGLPIFHGLEEGLQVAATPFTSANDMLNSLVAGQVDM